jgi:ectoine hydroxylase
MIADNYPTRHSETGNFITRKEDVVYKKPDCLSLSRTNSYIKDGFILIKDFFHLFTVKNAEIEADLLFNNKEYGLITMEPKKDFVRSITGIHNHYTFKDLANDNILIGIVKSILGSDIYIHQSRINYKAGLGANGWSWHSDFETWHAQDGMPGMRCLTAMIPLVENTEYNGSLMVIPSSHELFYSCRKEETVSAEENFADQKEGVPPNDAIEKFFQYSGNRIEMIKCGPGDLVLFDCNTIHVSTPNMTPFKRTNIFFVYNSIENKLVDPFSVNEVRPEEMGSRKNIKVI